MKGMMNERQLMFTLILIRVSGVLVLLPVVTAGDAGQDAWLSSILATFAGCLLGALSAWLSSKFPHESLGSFSKRLVGRPLGIVLTALIAMATYFWMLFRIRGTSLIIISQFLPRTPGWALALPMLVLSFYGAVTGPDSLGRSSEIIITVMAGTVVFGMVMVFVSGAGPMTDLRPFFAQGIRPILISSLPDTFLGAMTGSVALAFGRFTTKSRGIVKAVVGALLVSGIVITALAITSLITLGPWQARQSVAPLLDVAGVVYVEGVIERMDLFLLASWVLGVTFDTTVLLLSSSILIADAIGASFQIVAAVLTLLGALPVTLRFTDIFMLEKLESPLVTGFATLGLYVGVVGLLAVITLFHGRRRGKP